MRDIRQTTPQQRTRLTSSISLFVVLTTLVLGGCVQRSLTPDDQIESSSTTRGHENRRVIKSLAATIELAYHDRIRRLKRLSRRHDIEQPDLTTDLTMPAELLPNIDYDVPVVRVRYPSDALFAFDSAQLSVSARKVLDAINQTMAKDVPDVSLLIVGHTDARGTVSYNQTLSEKRARNAADYLVQHGMPKQQITYIGMSERQPIAPNSTAIGRAENRRVEFLISAYKEANLHFVQTRNIVCTYLDPKEFSQETCNHLAKSKQITVSQNDRTVSIDPSRKELLDSIAMDEGTASVQTHLRDPIPINPHAPKGHSIKVKHETHVIKLKPPRVYNVRIK